MARAAGVPFLYASATSFQSGLQGATSRKVRAYFRTMRKLAQQEGGAIGFIDEFDAIGGARSGMTMSPAPQLSHDHSACGGLVGLPASYANAAPAGPITNALTGSGDVGMAVNELLVQLQSFDEPVGFAKITGKLIDKVNLFLPDHRAIKKAPVKTANIMLIAATNRADNLDPALLRPGRFDRRLTFEIPDRHGRRELVDHFLARKSHVDDLDDDGARNAIAAVTSGFTPAMLEGMFDEAWVSPRPTPRPSARSSPPTRRVTPQWPGWSPRIAGSRCSRSSSGATPWGCSPTVTARTSTPGRARSWPT
jgi:SpoVK/Ycf46/Vps4 family AAA+-type ATPase